MMVFKRLSLLLSVLLLGTLVLHAQPTFDYGNTWYVPGQSYLKMQTVQDGLYRVGAADLAAAGFSVSPGDVAQLQVFYRGVEQYIHVQTSSGNFDYLEFYGRHHDGREDSIFYRSANPSSVHDPNSQPTIHHSLWTDTTTYYLTIGANPGRRVQLFNDQNYGNYSPEPFFRAEVFMDFPPVLGSAAYVGGGGSEYDTNHLLNSYYITGEGYAGILLGYNNPINLPIRTPHAANLGTPSVFSVRIFGQSTTRHDFLWTIDGTPVVRDTTYGIYIRTRSINYNTPLPALTNILYQALGTDNNNTDNNAFMWQSVQYDRLFNLDGSDSAKVVNWQKGSNAYFHFTNTAPTSTVLAWDITNNMRCIGTGNGNNTMDVVVPGAQNKRTIVVAGETEIKSPFLRPAALSNLSDPAAGAEFIIITHPSLLPSANAYKQYRDTCTVNQLSTRVVTINEIYDEFGYGAITPMAIKRFCKYAHDQYSTPPKFFMLWGKGQYETRFHPNNLVPTFGYPATDYEYVSDYDYNDINPKPETPIGRINIYNNQEGFQYLQKVNTYEHTPFAGWMKELIFLGGGNDTLEQGPILTYFRNDYSPFVQSAPFGGHVNYYQKFNTGVISNSNLTSTQRINEGSSIIHFFGHSSSNIYDVDIQEPVLYQNYNKMPLMVAFGCYGGNFAGDSKSFGERFVLQSERGSIGYLANSTAGFLSQLGNFGIVFYDNLYNKNYGQPIGVVVKEAIGDYVSRWSDENARNHAKQLNLQCDPSIVINSPDKPDLAIGPEDIYFTPNGFSASDSSFEINVITHNYGRATQDSFYLSVRQLPPNSSNWITYPKVKFPAVLILDTLVLTIPNTLGNGMAGLNSFDVFVDSTNLVTEISESNNRVFTEVVIPGNSPAILYPYPYAIIPENSVKLSAAAYVLNQLPVVRYQYEIDSVPDFSSPLKAVSPVITGTSFYSEWQVPFTLQDSGVYYWRVRLADNYPAAWSHASFKYIVDRRGWAQSQAPQFTEDDQFRITLDEVNRHWDFSEYSVDLSAFVAEGDFGAYRLANGAFQSSLSAVPQGGIKATTIRKLDLQPSIQNTIHGDWNYYHYADGQYDLANLIHTMPVGDYFFAVSEANPQAPLMGSALISALHSIGIDSMRMRNLPGVSFIILARKGFPGEAILIDQPNVYDQQQNLYRLDLRVALNTVYPVGRIGSTTIGPVSDWDQLYWNWGGLELFGKDDVEVAVYASPDKFNDSLIYSGLPSGFTGLSNLDASRYPYLHLEALVKDSARRTAPQMDHWHVFYSPVPDAAVDPLSNWAFQSDTLAPGQAGAVDFSAVNVSDYDLDSLLVSFAIRKADRSVVQLGTRRYGALAAHQAIPIHYDFSIPNAGVNGKVSFLIELNPGPEQNEQYYFNNYYQYPFFIQPDVIHPILDVTVDGKHLMEGDIVSPLPEILFEVNDENRYLAVNDTAFEVYFGRKTPSANLPRVFIGGNNQMEVQPASLPANKARLYFRPGRLDDGEYTLRVQGYDQAGNPAGRTKYEINFEVVNESALSNVLNYPNPFSTSTRFAYTMTGAEIPEVFQIHIYTITGRLVKVIDLHETNDVRIGRNLTDYTWDGRDEFGDLLANGVYVYRVVAKTNGAEMKNRDEGVTRMFDNGYGKMYIMR